MVRDYMLIVGEKDAERFRIFRMGKDYDLIKSIAKLGNAVNVWAIGPSTSDDLWHSIRRGDRMFFAENGLAFNRLGTVHSKVTNRSLAIRLWGDSPRMREHKRMILFSRVDDIDMQFHRTCKMAGIKSTSRGTNIYLSSRKIITDIQDGAESEASGTIMVSEDGAPNKKTEVVTRFIRDTVKVRKLKSLYEDKCQICGYVIQTLGRTRYSEVHHLHPLQDGGDDDFGNMIVLCPTHHVEFDYKVIGIDHNKKTIIDPNGNTIGKITTSKTHRLDKKNILFHLEGMGRS